MGGMREREQARETRGEGGRRMGTSCTRASVVPSLYIHIHTRIHKSIYTYFTFGLGL